MDFGAAAAAIANLILAIWAIWNEAKELKAENPWVGITGAVGMVYGIIGAIKEYEEVVCAIEDQAEVTERLLDLSRQRFERWKNVDLPYVLETQAWSLGLGWYKPDCGAVFSRWNTYASRATSAAIGMDSRWRDRWHLGNWPGGGQGQLSGIKGTIMAVAHISVYKSMLDNYYDSLDHADGAVSAAAGSAYANEAFNESTRLLSGAAMGYNHILGMHVQGLGQYVNLAGKGYAAMTGGGGGESV